MTPTDPLQFKTRLWLRATAQGGRRRPIFDLARANCDNGDMLPNGAPYEHDVVIRLANERTLAPGEEGEAVLVPALPEGWSMVEQGAWIVVKEGGRVIGVAHATEVLGRS